MMEQNVQTFITWTHGVRPTWLQYHGPSLHHCELGVPGEIHLLRRRRSSTLSLCLQYELPPHHFPEVNPARLPHPPTAEGNQRAALAIDHQHRARGLSSTRQSKCHIVSGRTLLSETIHRVHSQTIGSCYKVQNYEMQTLLPCPPAQWPEVSLSLRATSTGHFHCRCARHQGQ